MLFVFCAFGPVEPIRVVRQQAVVAPMGAARRADRPDAQAGRTDLTPRQARRLRQKENR